MLLNKNTNLPGLCYSLKTKWNNKWRCYFLRCTYKMMELNPRLDKFTFFECEFCQKIKIYNNLCFHAYQNKGSE